MGEKVKRGKSKARRGKWEHPVVTGRRSEERSEEGAGRETTLVLPSSQQTGTQTDSWVMDKPWNSSLAQIHPGRSGPLVRTVHAHQGGAEWLGEESPSHRVRAEAKEGN